MLIGKMTDQLLDGQWSSPSRATTLEELRAEMVPRAGAWRLCRDGALRCIAGRAMGVSQGSRRHARATVTGSDRVTY
ncbi:MAG: hypothetical protein R2712_07515 [Vicinamibacterales bacterium]